MEARAWSANAGRARHGFETRHGDQRSSARRNATAGCGGNSAQRRSEQTAEASKSSEGRRGEHGVEGRGGKHRCKDAGAGQMSDRTRLARISLG